MKFQCESITFYFYQIISGYTFVEYENAKDAKTALEEMDGFKFDRFPIAVAFKGLLPIIFVVNFK